MYIHWAHRYLPLSFGILSFIFNPICIFLILVDKKGVIGKYRRLLVFFAIFNMLYSAVEVMVPVAIHGTGSAFVIFLTDGFFFDLSQNVRIGQLAVSIRCGFIALSYGVLAVHFIYRYLVLFHPRLSNRSMSPSGFFWIITFFALHGIVWSTICEVFLYRNDETSEYIHQNFLKTFGENSYDIPMLIAIYSEVNTPILIRSWTGVLLLTVISIYAISLYTVLAFKIMQNLGNNCNLSKITQKLHRQLLKALFVQTFIPIVISFAPCMAAWYAPAVHINLGMWNNYLGVIALSTFPVFDPLAIIILIPTYRNKLVKIVKDRNLFVNSSHGIQIASTVKSAY